MSEQAPSKIIAGDAAILAKRYAVAFYELAEEQKQLDSVATDMRMLASLYEGSAEFRAIAAHPRLSRAQLTQVVKKIVESAKLGVLTKNFLGLVAQNRRLNQIHTMIDAFLAEMAKRRGEFTADVTTAGPLSPAQQEQLAAKLREVAGGKVHISVRNDASLLGGIMVKIGSRLIDASVKSKLARIERQLKSTTLNTNKGAA